MTMDELKPGQSAWIRAVGGDGALRRHLLDMGLTPRTVITLQKVAPMGDPVQITLRGYELTLRLDEARWIEIERVHPDPVPVPAREPRIRPIPHPGVGEGPMGRDAVRKDGPLTFALVGNQNCGKTTLFNQLTGSNQHVGNFPGVTVDRKDGVIRNHPEATVTDLPGIYSLSPYSGEELVTRDFLMEQRPSGIINIVDATNMERNLYLTMQLMELEIPMVLALNMMDEVRGSGGHVRVNQLEEILGIPVVPISAVRNEGIDELITHALCVARAEQKPRRLDFCLESDDPRDPVGAVHRCVHAAAMLLEADIRRTGLPPRFAVTKLVERDALMERKVPLSPEKQRAFSQLVSILEQETDLDREAAVANMRFQFLETLCRKTVVRPHESREHRRSVAMDRVLTGRYTAIPCFLGIMALVFVMTFGLFGSALSDLTELGVGWITDGIDLALTAWDINPVVHDLVVNGICAGVGSVLSFLPTIVTLFFFLSILEDTGYMARVAFVMDRPLRKLGLSGRSFVPMLIGFGCSVPAIMATRTLSSERDRKMTILLTPFMSCSAKLPIYTLLVSAFFPRHWQPLVLVGLYGLGILCGALYALVLKATRFTGEAVPFVMELPNYRLPSARSVGQLLWEKASDFVQKAFTIIFAASVLIWVLQTFDLRLNVTANPEESLLAALGGLLAPLFAPLGFGDWRAATAIITGFTAKESMVSTLTLLAGGNPDQVAALFTPATATVFLVFALLYTPCVAAVATVKREMGSAGAAAVTVILQCCIAWLAAFVVRMILLTLGL